MKDQTPNHRLLIYQANPALSKTWLDHLLSQSQGYQIRRTANRREEADATAFVDHKEMPLAEV